RASPPVILLRWARSPPAPVRDVPTECAELGPGRHPLEPHFVPPGCAFVRLPPTNAALELHCCPTASSEIAHLQPCTAGEVHPAAVTAWGVGVEQVYLRGEQMRSVSSNGVERQTEPRLPHHFARAGDKPEAAIHGRLNRHDNTDVARL